MIQLQKCVKHVYVYNLKKVLLGGQLVIHPGVTDIASCQAL